MSLFDRIFCTPDQIDDEDEQKILTYNIDGFTIDFEMNPDSGTLMRMEIYPTVPANPL